MSERPKAVKCHPGKADAFDGYCEFCLLSVLKFVAEGKATASEYWIAMATASAAYTGQRPKSSAKRSRSQCIRFAKMTRQERVAMTEKARAVRWASKDDPEGQSRQQVKKSGRWVTIATNRIDSPEITK